ncbi:MAG: uracil-DNA glycosylase [Planctomycetaceae bacterium]
MDARTTRALKQRLESLAEAGVTSLPRPTRGAAVAGTQPEAEPPRPSVTPVAPAATDRIQALGLLHQQVAGCTRCAELAATRTQTVFGAGNPAARLCFFGEAPGADEDSCGEPFVGRAGQLLTKIIEACTLTRDDVFILNVLKCRPPGNRTPDPAEVANCRPFFERQFEVIAPEFICCLGTTAAHALLRTTEPIGRLRRRWFDYGAAQVICTYHPSYLLRNPAAKKDVWEDMKMLMERMGVRL